MWRSIGTYCGPRSARALILYMRAECESQLLREAFACYVADSLYYAQQGMRLDWRFGELLRPDELGDETAEEIAERIASALEEDDE